MRKFVIIGDSCCDLDFNLRSQYDIDYIPMHFNANGKEYVADLDWKELPVKDFYNLMRNGTRILTAQVTAFQYQEKFEKYVKEGYDVLSISCSSALSSSVKASYTVRDELMKKYPECKIVCVDSLNSSFGIGLLCIRASVLRSEGKTIEEVEEEINKLRFKINQIITPEKLSYLKQAGRVSATSAFFGGILNIKPIIISDAKGQNVAIEKVKGRKVAFERIAELTKEVYEELDYQMIYICHSDCEDDANELKRLILEKVKTNVEIKLGYIGPIVGGSVGPGSVAVQLFGKEVTLNK